MLRNKLLTRRHILWLSLASLAGIGTVARGKSIEGHQQAQTLDDSERDFTAVGELPLKERAAAKGIIYGAAATHRELTDTKFANSHTQECSLLLPGWEFGWHFLRPSIDNFDFTHSDRMVEYAKSRNMLLHGHPLIWGYGMPQWFWNQANRNFQNAEQLMVNHITKVMGHYAGQMYAWNVVNEGIDPNSGRADGLADSRWLQWLGPDYIDLAFRAAAQADPQALLVYNDNRMDSNTEDGEAKRVAVLKLLERLKSKGTPIHALGMQAHIWGRDQAPLNQRKIRAFVREVADLGLKILVTELDVKDVHLPKDIEVRDRLIAQTYEDYLSTVLDEPAVIAVITWGLSDRYTWYNNPQYGGARKDGGKFRPLPLDAQLNRKLAWNAIARAFDNAPNR